MLQQIRGAMKGVVVWIVLILLVAAFALWGVPDLSQVGSNAAVTVGGKKYSSQYVQSELTRALQAQRNETGQAMTLEQARETGFHNDVLSNIITRSALEQFHDAMGLSTPSAVVRDFLRDDPNYQDPVTGEFDETRLRTILAQNSLTPSEFERLIGQSILQEQFFSAFILRGPAPEPMVSPLVKRDVERREIAYLVVSDEMAG
ncbi:MAG: SurA N-terminal domain-containing protein, partial [Pseudomonadota bacterium]